MKRQTIADLEQSIREELHEIRDVIKKLSLRVDVLWEERQRRLARGPEPEERR